MADLSHLKVLMCGDGCIGKTCLLNTLCNKPVTDWDAPVYRPTAAENLEKEWINEDTYDEFSVTFWDTAGQEALEQLRKPAYCGTDILLVGFDMTKSISLENVESWVKEFKYEVPNDPVSIILIGTKFDLYEDLDKEGTDFKPLATIDDMYETAVQIGAHAFIATSALCGLGLIFSDYCGDGDLATCSLRSWKLASVQTKILELASARKNSDEIPMLKTRVKPDAPVARVAPQAPVPALLAMDANLATQVQMAIMEVPGLIEEVRETLGRDVSNSDLRRFIEKIVRTSARELFDNLDQDGDGVITMREVGKAFRGKRKDELRNMVSMHGMDWRDFEDGLYEVPTNPDGSIGFEAFEDYLDQKGGPAEPAFEDYLDQNGKYYEDYLDENGKYYGPQS